MIPAVIYQTWKTKQRGELTFTQRRWVGSWLRKNPGFRHQLHDDHDCLAFVHECFPEHVVAYERLSAVEKADMWRYMVLYRHGGVYCDLDTVCRVPLDRWLGPNDGLVIGIEDDFIDRYPEWRPRRKLRSGGVYDPECYWRDNLVPFCNWTIAARTEHPLLADVIRRIAINLDDPLFRGAEVAWTIKKTGPGVFTDAVIDWVESHGVKMEDVARKLRVEREVRVGNAKLLDRTAFNHRLVRHVGMGSWKPGGLAKRSWRRIRCAFS